MTDQLSAEWAYWGKKPEDDGFRQLGCSRGAITQENFDQVITRYSPGTLDSAHLPQVTFAWLPGDEPGADYLALAIHSRRVIADASVGLADADRGPGAPLVRLNREFVLTSYYCVPFGELAAARVSYPALYETFRMVPLPIRGGHLATAPLAALLGPNRPVCILGAGGLDVSDRLAFIETVATLLPYGRRSRLSAATWTSSTARKHRYRLFFAGSERNREDHIVTWDDTTLSAIGDFRADGYLEWLYRDPDQRANRLLRETSPAGFHPDEVRQLFGRLGIIGPRPELPAPPRPAPKPDVRRPVSVMALLHEASESLDDSGRLRGCVAGLRQHVGIAKAQRERESYQQAMAERRLLRASVRADTGVLAEFYAVVLQLAFPGSLTYEDFCHIEACAGVADGDLHLHLSLLLAVDGHPLDEQVMHPLMRVLLWREQSVSSGACPAPDLLIALAAQPSLGPRHAILAYDLLTDLLLAEPGPDPAELRETLASHGYLAAVMEHQLADRPGYQVWVLWVLICAAHGTPLDRATVNGIRAFAEPGSLALDVALLISDERGSQLRPGLADLLAGRSRWGKRAAPGPTGRHEQAAGPAPAAAAGGMLESLKRNFENAREASRPRMKRLAVVGAFVFLLLVIAILLTSRYA